MGQVLPLVCQSRVDEAWEEHCHFSRKLMADPSLLLDRQFMEQHTRAHERWKRLFLMQEAGQ